MKPIIIMATTLFLISAPTPDAGDIAELTSNFIVPENIPGLQAGQEITNQPASRLNENITLAVAPKSASTPESKSQSATTRRKPPNRGLNGTTGLN